MMGICRTCEHFKPSAFRHKNSGECLVGCPIDEYHSEWFHFAWDPTSAMDSCLNYRHGNRATRLWNAHMEACKQAEKEGMGYE